MTSNHNCEPHTPPRKIKRVEFDTLRKTRFFTAFDAKKSEDSLAGICRQPDINIPPSTARFWLQQRESIGSPAFRRTRKLSSRLGRNFTLCESVLDELLGENHPLNEKPYATQVEELHLPVAPRTLQWNFSRRKGARRYKKPYTKEISEKNKQQRLKYGEEHQKETIRAFWQYILFTDEAHFSSRDLQNASVYALRQPSANQRLSRLKETRVTGLDVTLHVAAGISYNMKGELLFYNDPEDEAVVKKRLPRKPRKSSVETEAEYTEKVEKWRASLPHPAEIKATGNSMTQKYYTEKILPHHIKAVKAMEERLNHSCWLQEDNDGSHGTRSINNPARRLKSASHVQSLIHPAQSPDLNPIESIWQVIKQRLRGGSWQSASEFKEAIRAEWRHISLAQIRRRIREMPQRCKSMVNTIGNRYRSHLW